MASISKLANGRRMIQFVDPNGSRKTVRLGKMSQRDAESVKVKIESLLASRIAGHSPTEETSVWLRKIDDQLRERLAAVGLAERCNRQTLKAFIDGYVESRKDVKALTRLTWESSVKRIVERFGAETDLRSITAGDADEWRTSMVVEGLEEPTIGKHVKHAKQFFRAAVRRRLISENPFGDVKSTKPANRNRDHFITRADAQKVLEACPDAQWRLLFALSRFGGLRCPSEHLRLTWGDVDWENGRLTVHSPKTEHHEGKDVRIVPLFPELRPYLEAAFDEAEPGTEHVITRYRDVNSNLRTQLRRIIKRAGLVPWPKLFHNLRSTRQTELEETFPSHVVCSWIGNSESIARKHYLQVTDDHFGQALQKALHHPATRNATELYNQGGESKNTQQIQSRGEACSSVVYKKIGPRGLEPRTNRL